ncbi:MAG: hypothetical protein ABI665_14665, partial [Vicinamibacterales bacterium]
MAILSGDHGQVLYDPAATLPVAVANAKKWSASFKTDKYDTTCFGALNKKKVVGLPDISGSLELFWDSTDVVLFEAASAVTPGLLKLVPNSTEATAFWSGPAYLDAAIDVAMGAGGS